MPLWFVEKVSKSWKLKGEQQTLNECAEIRVKGWMNGYMQSLYWPKGTFIVVIYILVVFVKIKI